MAELALILCMFLVSLQNIHTSLSELHKSALNCFLTHFVFWVQSLSMVMTSGMTAARSRYSAASRRGFCLYCKCVSVSHSLTFFSCTILNMQFIKGLVDFLSPLQTHFFFPFLSLARLPLTAAFSSSSPPALRCHSSSVSFSSPLPHGTTSVWKPRSEGSRQIVQ